MSESTRPRSPRPDSRSPSRSRSRSPETRTQLGREEREDDYRRRRSSSAPRRAWGAPLLEGAHASRDPQPPSGADAACPPAPVSEAASSAPTPQAAVAMAAAAAGDRPPYDRTRATAADRGERGVWSDRHPSREWGRRPGGQHEPGMDRGRMPHAGERRVLVDNVDVSVPQPRLRKMMKAAGRVLNVEVLLNSDGSRNGEAVVEFAHPSSARWACEKLHLAKLNGQAIFVRADHSSAPPPRRAPPGMSVDRVSPPRRRDPRDMRDPRDVRDTRHVRDPPDARDTREPRDLRDARDMRDSRDLRDTRDSQDARDRRDVRDARDPRDPRDARDVRYLRDARDPRDPWGARDVRELRDSRDLRDARDARSRRSSVPTALRSGAALAPAPAPTPEWPVRDAMWPAAQLVVDNLPTETERDDLFELFDTVAPLQDADLERIEYDERGSATPTKRGFVRFASAIDAGRALERFDNYMYGELSLRVSVDQLFRPKR